MSQKAKVTIKVPPGTEVSIELGDDFDTTSESEGASTTTGRTESKASVQVPGQAPTTFRWNASGC